MSKAGGNRVVYWNGQFIPEREARVSIYDSALMFGDVVFEMTRSFNGKQWRLRDHLQRLYDGIKILRIPIQMSMDAMESAVYATIDANAPHFERDDEHRILINVTRGLLSLYEGIDGVPTGPNVIIADFPLRWTVAGAAYLYDEGVNMVIPWQRAIPAQYLDPKIKNRSRMFYLTANMQVSGYAGKNNWALLLDPDGYIAEGTGSNFFMAKDGVLFTPEPRNILRGITRASIIEEIAPRIGIKVIERNIEPYDVYTADEAFVTSTPFCLVPVVSLDGVNIGNARPGEITQQLLRSWSELVGVDIVGQIRGWQAEPGALASNAPSPYRFKRG
jgi:branched-chain amino acid aminotransferase